MTRETLESLVLEATGRTDKTSLIRTAIDLAVEEISTQRMWTDLQTEAEATLTADEPSISLAEDVTRVTEIRLIDGTLSRPLIIRAKNWITQYFPDPESRSSGRPAYGYLEGRTLHLVPVPDDAYVIRYTYFPLHAALESPTSPLLIRAASRAIVAYATFWIFQSLEKHEDAKRWLDSYFSLLESAKKVDSGDSVINRQADARGSLPANSGDYWLDPMVRSAP